MSDLMRWGRDPFDGWLYPEPTGFWTPWDTANAEITRLRAENAELRNRLVNLEDEKNDYINCVGDALGQAPDGESLWDAAQRVLSDRDRVRQERDELRAQLAEAERLRSAEAQAAIAAHNELAQLRTQIAAHEKVCAGVWVKVTERLPEENGDYMAIHANEKSKTRIELIEFDRRHKWVCAAIWTPVFWLDARLPGEEPKKTPG